MSLREQVLHGLRWTAGARFGGQLVTWAVTIVVMRLLSPADYGLLNMAAVFVGLLGLFSEFGLGAAIVRARDVDDAMLRRVLGLVLVIHGALCLLLVALSPLVAALYREPRVAAVVATTSLQFPITAFMVVPEALLQRRMEFRRRSLLSLSAALAQSAATLVLALAGHGVWSLVWGNLLGAAWQTVGTNLLVACPRLPVFSLAGAREFLTFGGHLTLSRVLWFLYSQVDAFLGGKLLGKEPLGYYAVAKHIGSLTLQRIAPILNQVAYPAFARIQDQRDLLASHFVKAVRVISFFSFPVQWGIASVAPETVAVLLGAGWEPAVLPLQMFSAILPLMFVQHMLPSPLNAIGRPDIQVRILAACCVVYPAAFAVGARWGIEGFSLAWVVAAPFAFLWNLHQACPALGVPLRSVLAAIARPSLGAAAMSLAVLAARQALPWSALPRLCALILVGASAHLGCVLAFDRPGLREVLALVRRPRASSAGG